MISKGLDLAKQQMGHPQARLADLLGDLLADEPNEVAGWVCYLLEAIQNRVSRDDMTDILETLQEDIQVTLELGRW